MKTTKSGAKLLKLKDLSPEIKKRICRALYSTWEAIGGDTAQYRQECGEHGPTPRNEVIECVLDADRTAMYGNDKEAVDTLTFLSYDEQSKLAKEAFPYKFYE
jgi:hypothetical protein